MKTYILSNYNEILRLANTINILADRVGSTLPFHRLHMLLLWWQYFSTQEHTDFAARRGRNFFGKKSWLKKLSFLIVEEDESIVGVAPLFESEVLLNRKEPNLKLLSFSPDSGLFFFQDFLVLPERRREVIACMFEKIERLLQVEKFILFLGHIPENSPNLLYYRQEIDQRKKIGWNGGETLNTWRGGAYPWNLRKLSQVLNTALKNTSLKKDLLDEITALRDSLEKQTSTLLVFTSTRAALELQIHEIAKRLEEQPETTSIADNIVHIMMDKPILYPFMEVPKDVDTFFQSLSPSKRYYYRRYLKKFHEKGGIFEKIEPQHIKKSDIDAYLTLHLERWNNDSAAVNDYTRSFHEESAVTMANSGYFRLFFASIDNTRLAALSCFDINNRREFYYSGRSLNDRKFRAGKLLVAHAIMDAIENNISIFDFGYGDDEYKFDFANKNNSVKSIILTKEKTLPDLEKLFPYNELIVI